MSVDASASLSGVVAGYGSCALLGPLDLTLGRGITALLGRNGSGKTTLMRTLCGIIPTLAGTCTVLGQAVSDGATVRSRIGYLGHEPALATALTVEQNLRFWARIAGTYAAVVQIGELVERFDLEPLLSKKVSTLSRGQTQRVDLARLAMTDPEFIVLDEPLTGLDPVYAAQTRSLLQAWGETGSVLYSTHSVPEALQLAQRYLIISGRNLVELDQHESADTDGTVVEASILEALEATS